MQEKRARAFQRLFDHLGIDYALDEAGEPERNGLLRYRGRSLKLRFHEATATRMAYFSAEAAMYQGFSWDHWLEARSLTPEKSYNKVIPYPGEELAALQALLDYVRSQLGLHE